MPKSDTAILLQERKTWTSNKVAVDLEADLLNSARQSIRARGQRGNPETNSAKSAATLSLTWTGLEDLPDVISRKLLKDYRDEYFQHHFPRLWIALGEMECTEDMPKS